MIVCLYKLVVLLYLFVFSSDVTHIVTEFDTIEAVLRKLDLPNTEDLGGAKVVKVAWFTDCMRAGHVVDVLEEHKVPSSQTVEVLLLDIHFKIIIFFFKIVETLINTWLAAKLLNIMVS